MNTVSGNIQKRYNFNFHGGLKKAIISEIQATDCNKIQKNLNKLYGIKSDFSNNKIIAWSMQKTIDLMQELNKKYRTPLICPLNVIVDNLENYFVDNSSQIYGFTNFLPCKLKKNSREITPALSIIFNKDFPWDKLDEISDYDYFYNNTVTNHFLESFFHEISHVIHGGHLLKKYSENLFYSKLSKLNNKTTNMQLKKKFENIISEKLCKYASLNSFDLIACDLSGRFINSLDLNKLEFNKNPYKNSPYNLMFNLKKIFKPQDVLDILVNKIFNGNTEILNN